MLGWQLAAGSCGDRGWFLCGTELNILVAFLLLFNQPRHLGLGLSCADGLQGPDVSPAHYPAEDLLWLWVPSSPPVNGLTTSLLSTHTRALIPQIPCVSAWGFVAHLQGTLPSSFSLFLTIFLLLFSSAFILLLFFQILERDV